MVVQKQSDRTGGLSVKVKATINAKDLIGDIRSGMDDAALMSKYKLSSKGLQSAFSKLIGSRLISIEEIFGERRSGLADTVIIDDQTLIETYFDTLRPLCLVTKGQESKGQFNWSLTGD